MKNINKRVPKKLGTLPVYLFLDTSTSMNGVIDIENGQLTGETFFADGQMWEYVSGGGITKLEQLNKSVSAMLEEFKKINNIEFKIDVAVITFSDEARLKIKPTSVMDIHWQNIIASGETSLGAALKMGKAIIEDLTYLYDYLPIIILVSDGNPTDKWEKILEGFIKRGCTSKCNRMAMAIGANANKTILNQFITGTSNKLFYADSAKQIHKFFQIVVATRPEERYQ